MNKSKHEIIQDLVEKFGEQLDGTTPEKILESFDQLSAYINSQELGEEWQNASQAAIELLKTSYPGKIQLINHFKIKMEEESANIHDAEENSFGYGKSRL